MESKEIRALSLDVHATFQFWMCMQPADVDSSFNSGYACNQFWMCTQPTNTINLNPIQLNTFCWFFMEKYTVFFFFLDFEN